MNYRIGIHKDEYGIEDSSYPIWIKLLKEASCDVKIVDVYSQDILEQLRDCHGFMWRWAHFGGMRRLSKRLLPVLENNLDLVVYPSQNTCWHYDDKVAQRYLFEALELPTPKTWIFYDFEEAEAWSKQIEYPVVLKLSAGASSSNVKLINSSSEGIIWINRLFKEGVSDLEDNNYSPWSFQKRVRAAMKALLKGEELWKPPIDIEDIHHHYAYFQEFLPDNDFDTRVVVIGNRAFAFRRFNRPNDFRASGSGNVDLNPNEIDERFIRLAFQLSLSIGSQSCAIDGLYKNGIPVVGEVSYTYLSGNAGTIRKCPGHWILNGDTADSSLSWCEGKMWPEEAQIEDFLSRLKTKFHELR